MAWIGNIFYSEEEVKKKSCFVLPSEFQPGEDIWFHAFKDNKESIVAVPAIIASVNMNGIAEVSYNLYLQVSEDMYVLIKEVKGYISKPGIVLDSNGVFVPLKEVDSAGNKNTEIKFESLSFTNKDTPTKPSLTLVSSKKD